MEVLTFAALAMTLTALFMMARINLLRFLGYAGVVDVVFSLAMLTMFASTFSGVVASALAGLFMTAILTLLRKLLGYERLVWGKWYKPEWVYTAPAWNIRGLSSRLQQSIQTGSYHGNSGTRDQHS